ncbi:MAG: S41 family peptidase [Ginsengibacter sp.]
MLKAIPHFPLVLLLFVYGCTVSKPYSPQKKYSKETLQQDFSLLRTILEKKHPSLYWYTPKDSMDHFFNEKYKSINDSMTELQFAWKVIAPLLSKIKCGHTTFSMSKGWQHYIQNKRIPSFPVYVRVWPDTMVVMFNLNKTDTLKKGTVITAINGVKIPDLFKQMFPYMAQDGYAESVNYTRLSLSFPYFHRNILGLYKKYSVDYIDSLGNNKKTVLPYFNPVPDSLKHLKSEPKQPKIKITRRNRLSRIRSLQIDTFSSTATMKISSFSKGHLPNFFKSSFKKIRRADIKNVVIDIRNNGGGDINNFVSLARYIRNTDFKVADTAVALAKNFRPYNKYIKANFFDRPGLFFLTRKGKDNRYHFGFWEDKTFKPRHKNHFNGDTYVLTNGLTFSASSLFCNSVKDQGGVTLVGEETGGGWHGNSGIVIPDIVLPLTKLRVRLPFFKLVQYNHVPKNGSGVQPDIEVQPTVSDVINNVDRKMELVKELIKQKTK